MKTTSNKVVRRIRLWAYQPETIKRLNISSLDMFVRRAVDEKLERDFKVKIKTL